LKNFKNQMVDSNAHFGGSMGIRHVKED